MRSWFERSIRPFSLRDGQIERSARKHRPTRPSRPSPERTVLNVERLECRNAPAIVSFAAGVLAVDFTATGTTAEAVTISQNGAAVSLTGNVSGTTSIATASITRIVLSASGDSTNQSVDFSGAGTGYSLSDGLSSTGVDSVTVSQPIVADHSSILISAPGAQGAGVGVTVNSPISTVAGDISITGIGGSSGDGNDGVLIAGNGSIAAGAPGTATVVGIGGASGTGNHGVVVSGASAAIDAVGSSVSITGTGGASGLGQDGILLSGGGHIAADSVTLQGTGGSTLANVVLVGAGSTITAPSGALTVNGVVINGIPSITSANSATFTADQVGTFSALTTGSPAPAVFATGPLPPYLTLNTDGTLTGAPAPGSAGTYPLTLSAYNGISFQQPFTLTVNPSAPIAVSSATGTVFDATRQILYVMNGTNALQRFDVAHNVLLAPWTFGTKLGRGDITSDSAFLYVTDFGANVVHKVNLSTGSVTDLPFTTTTGETGSFDIKIASNGLALFDTITSGSARVRTINLGTGALADSGTAVVSLTTISRSADGSRLYFDQASANLFSVYTASTGVFGATIFANTTLTGSAAVSRDGSFFSFQSAGVVAITDSSFGAVQMLPAYLGGYAFSPTQNLFFVADAASDVIIAYDTTTWQKKYQFSAEEDIGNAAAGSLGAGTMIASSDGTRLFLVTGTDVRQYVLPQNTGVATTFSIDAPVSVSQNTTTKVTVTARDPAGNVVPGYRGTVRFSSTDPSATVPAPYTFTAADNGVHTFQVAFGSVGTFTVTFSDFDDNLSASVSGVQVRAPGISLLPASNGRDLIFDSHRNLLYIPTTTGLIQRYDLTTDSLLTPWTVSGGPLGGGDITPDGKYLYIADQERSAFQFIIEKIDLDTGFVTVVPFAMGSESSAWDLKIAGNGFAVVTMQRAGSGPVNLKLLNLATGVVSNAGSQVNQGTLLTRAADYSRVLVVNSQQTYPVYVAATGTFTFSSNVASSTPAVVSRDGRFIAARDNGLVSVSDANFNAVANLPALIGGFAFSPTQDLFFAVDAVADTINAYDTNTWQLRYQFPVGQDVGNADASGNTGVGVMTLSADGTRLFLVTSTGVRQYLLPQSTGVAASLSVAVSKLVAQNTTIRVTVTAKDLAGNIATGYRGTVQLSVDDPAASLPPAYTFTAADAGVHTFQITLGTPGTDTLLVADAASGLSSSAPGIQVHAAGIASLLSIANGRETIFDSQRNLVYIPTAAGTVERYDLATDSLLTPWIVSGAPLGGGDITPDGKFLYVADKQRNIVQDVIRKIDLATGISSIISFVPGGGDLGAWDLKIAGNGTALVTVQHTGSGAVDLRTLSLATGVVTDTGQIINQGTLLARSGDYGTILVENTGKTGPLYSAATGSFTATPANVTTPTVLNHDGTLLAAQVTGLVAITDASFHAVASLPALRGGFAFDPVHALFYAVDAVADTINAYDTSLWQLRYQIPVGENVGNFDTTGNTGVGDVSLSGDGARLFLVTSTGVRQYLLPQPTGLAASISVSASRFVSQNASFDVTVTVKDVDGSVATGYRGNVQLGADDPAAVLPPLYTFTAADNGVHTFRISLGSVGVHTLTATDAANNLLATVTGIQVHAPGIAALLPVANSRDLIYDPTRNLLYVPTADGTIERYDPSTDSLLAPLSVTNSALGGGDITPDGKYLYVADTQKSVAQDVVWKVDLATGLSTRIAFAVGAGEGGAWDLKIAGNGTALLDESFTGSGAIPLRSLNLATDVVSATGATISQSTPISRSADRSVFYFAQPNSSAGQVFTYVAATGTFGPTFNSSVFLGAPTAVSRDGKYLATQVDGFVTICDLNFKAVATLPAYLGGYAFSPTQDVFYVADASSDAIVAYDTNTWQPLYRFAVGENIGNANQFPGPTGDGLMTVSSDGTRLYLVTDSGIRQYALPPHNGVAASLSVDVPRYVASGTPIQVTVTAKDAAGNVAVGYRGTVQISVADSAASLPTPYTFTAADNGVHTFQISFGTVGTDTLTIADAGDSLTASVSGVVVHAPGAATLPIAGGRDMIFDSFRNRLYVTTNASTIERYDVATDSLLGTWQVAQTALVGGDITPDGKYLYVGESQKNTAQVLLLKVDLDTGASTVVSYTPDFGDTGAWDIKIAADGTAFVSGQHGGSSAVHEWLIDTSTDVVTRSAKSVSQSMNAFRSADGSRLLFAKDSSATAFTYSVGTGAFTEANTSIPDLAAVNRDGSLLAYHSGNSTIILDGANPSTIVQTIPGKAGGVAFDPNRDLLFIADTATNTVFVYDTKTWALKGSVPVGVSIGAVAAFGNGEIAVDSDSSRLFIDTPSGVQIVALPNAAPLIVSAASAVFTTGQAGSFSFVAYGPPTPTIRVAGALPSGVTFDAGAGKLTGTPAVGSGGVYALTITANNGTGSPASQSFTLTVDEPPAIASTSASFVAGQFGSFAIEASGYPLPTFSYSGTLPTGVTLSSSGLLSGTPATRGIYGFTISADNGIGSPAQQDFTLRVEDVTPPVVTIASKPPAASDNAAARFVFFAKDPIAAGYASGVDHIEVSLDGKPFAAATSPAVYTGLTSGIHTFQARALDVAGNVSDVATYSWTVDLSAPTETIDITSVALQPSADLALDNDFTRFANAFANVQVHDTVVIHGTLDWSEANALASWRSFGAGHYSFALPAVDQITVTAASAGDGLRGPGDIGSDAGVDVSGEGPFRFAAGAGSDSHWTIQNLTIANFDTAISFAAGANLHAYDGAKILNNAITVAGDVGDLGTNAGILLAASANQTVQGNAIGLLATGSASDASVGIGSARASSAAWDNLLIDNNVVHVLANSAEKIVGIDEGSGSVGSKITVSNNRFVSDAAGNDPATNRQIGFGITSESVAATASHAAAIVAYSGNQVQGAHVGFEWGVPTPSGSATDPAYDWTDPQYLGIAFTNNSLANVGEGFFAQSGGKGTFSRTTIANAGLWNLGTAFHAKGAGTVLTVNDPTTNFTGLMSLKSEEAGGLVVFTTIALDIAGVARAEGNIGSTMFSFPVTLDVAPGANQYVTVRYAVSGGGGAYAAANGNDFSAGAGTLTFLPTDSNPTMKAITVLVFGDFMPEPDEAFTVILSAPQLFTNGVSASARLSHASALGVIVDDDFTNIAASIAGVAQKEGNSGSSAFAFPVTLNSAPTAGQYFTVDYAASTDGAGAGHADGNDFAAPSGTLTFAAGATMAPLTVNVYGDTMPEPNETFKVTLANPRLHYVGVTQSIPGNVSGSGTATGTILDDDTNSVVVSINSVSQNEGTSSTASYTPFTFTISVTGTVATTFKVNWTTASAGSGAGYADGNDYLAAAGQVTFTSGSVNPTATLTVSVRADKMAEPNEIFEVVLSSPTNPPLFKLGTSIGIGTIRNDD
jgi:sugar lactone lactonase YvrE